MTHGTGVAPEEANMGATKGFVVPPGDELTSARLVNAEGGRYLALALSWCLSEAA
jgi:hypothetical protein